MRRHLAAVDRAALAHGLLDEGVAGAALHGLTVRACDHVAGVQDHAGVVDDAFAGVARQERLRQQADDVFAGDESARAVEQETAVEIPVPRDAQVGPVRAHGVGGHRLVFGQQRVRDPVREGRVGIVVDADEPQGRAAAREFLGDGVEGGARHAVARVDQHRHGPQRARVHEIADGARIGGPRVAEILGPAGAGRRLEITGPG